MILQNTQSSAMTVSPFPLALGMLCADLLICFSTLHKALCAIKFNLVLKGRYSVFQYDGSTSHFTSASHRDKNLDLEHENYQVELAAEMPLGRGPTLSVGVRYQHVHTAAEITAKSQTTEEIIENRERFDKEAAFTISTLPAIVGLTF